MDVLEALAEECELVTRTVGGLDEAGFDRPTRLPAWNVKELLAHVYRDVDRLNVALAEPPPPAVDADSVSYWRSYDPATDGPDTAERAKEVAASHPTGLDLARAWDAMWREALAKAAGADPERAVATWGPTLTLQEFLKTRVLEVTVHRMDLEHALGRKGWGTDAAVSIVDDMLVGLLGAEPPDELDWDSVDFIDAGTGRRPLTDDERDLLGPLAARFPLLS